MLLANYSCKIHSKVVSL